MSHSHHFHTLAESEQGYVGICEVCRTVNIAFQNSLFCLAISQFDAFKEMVYERLAMRPVSTSHGKDFLLPTPMPNYFLLFSHKELDQFCALLSEATPVMEAERILSTNRQD
ncbi:MAG: hypothetical protein EOO88_41525 [Pedobacter sp.]|nr:MAG: hypothetical protein EOO88_41525 [Pedobacter sp.]